MIRVRFASFLACFVVAGCNYNHVKDAGSPTGAPGVSVRDLGPLDFATVDAGVIGPKCLSCHSHAGGDKGGTNLESYQSLRSLLPRVSDRALEKKDMPPGAPLSDGERQALQGWIDAGAPEKLSAAGFEKPDPTIETGPSDFAKVKDKIFAGKCLDCHSGTAPQAGLDLTSLERVRLKATAIFDRVIVKQDMPVAPYPALTPPERRVLLRWFDRGMPQ